MSSPAVPRLIRLLAREPDAGRLLPSLAQAAREATGASVAALLGPSAERGWSIRAAAGLDPAVPHPWLDDDGLIEAADRALTLGAPKAVTGGVDLMRQLSGPPGTTPRTLVVPIVGASCQPGVLLLASSDPVDPDVAAALGDAFAVALDRAALEGESGFRDAVRESVEVLARDSASPGALNGALVTFCREIAELTDATTVRVWLHDRQLRALNCAAASSASRGDTPAIPAADEQSPVARALHCTEGMLAPDAAHPGAVSVFVGLKGRRRALGVLELEGAIAREGDTLLDRCREIGRQLSSVLENVQLLDEVIRSRAELQNVFDALSELVVVIGPDDRVANVNRACAAFAGRERGAMIGRKYDDVLPAVLAEWVEQQRSAGAPPAAGVLDDAARQTMFELTLVSALSPVHGQSAYVLVGRDITLAARLERERVELTRRLAQTEKLLALGQFVAGIAHELNNPLQGVLGHLELIRASRDVPRALRRDLGVVYREADRAARIVRNLLVFAGSGRLQRRRLSINGVVSRVLRLRARTPHSPRLTRIETLDRDVPALQGDRLLLEQVLLNLVVNAEQAAGEGGRIEVRTTAGESGVSISVSDTGPGLPESVRARLFEPFFTTRADQGGTGLGLAIAYGVAQAHGGRIDAHAPAEGGAVFTIWLPAAPPRRRN